jgi:hypothetical protein
LIIRKNKALIAAGIGYYCDLDRVCRMDIMDSHFSQNEAVIKGGVIDYNLFKPFITNTVFEGNSAPYGADLAGFPYQLRGLDVDSVAPAAIVGGGGHGNHRNL